MTRRTVGFSTFGRLKASKAVKVSTEITPRSLYFEGVLCEAIHKRVLVEIRYKDDPTFRLIAPYVVFETESGNICLSCYQVQNPDKPQDSQEPRNFTVGKITGLRPTAMAFAVDPRFDRQDPKYQHRVLCSI